MQAGLHRTQTNSDGNQSNAISMPCLGLCLNVRCSHGLEAAQRHEAEQTRLRYRGKRLPRHFPTSAVRTGLGISFLFCFLSLLLSFFLLALTRIFIALSCSQRIPKPSSCHLQHLLTHHYASYWGSSTPSCWLAWLELQAVPSPPQSLTREALER